MYFVWIAFSKGLGNQVVCLIKLYFTLFCPMYLFIVCSMGGLVVKQILHKAKEERFDNLMKNTIGIVSIDSLIKYML